MLDSSFNPHFHRLAVFVAVACLVLLPGCVRRRLMVRSNPPGAMVYVDNQLIGTTPCATDFIYYGTREVRLVKPGFETLTVSQPIPAPWYQIPPIDFVSENLYPHKIQDYRTVSYNLVPQVIVPTEQLLGRAEELRQSTQQGAVLPPPAVVPPGPAIPVLPPGTQPLLTNPTESETLVPSGVIAAPPGSLPSGGQPLVPLP
ncbi:PEGA domain-containing protein [Bythopirellula polymerisocia]|nr:PEGA domain-containing protein [Bythopirellula polymerisocia]